MEFHVITVDAAKVPRIVFSNPNAALVKARADSYWDTEAAEGEMVFVGSDNCQTVKRCRRQNNN